MSSYKALKEYIVKHSVELLGLTFFAGMTTIATYLVSKLSNLSNEHIIIGVLSLCLIASLVYIFISQRKPIPTKTLALTTIAPRFTPMNYFDERVNEEEPYFNLHARFLATSLSNEQVTISKAYLDNTSNYPAMPKIVEGWEKDKEHKTIRPINAKESVALEVSFYVPYDELKDSKACVRNICIVDQFGTHHWIMDMKFNLVLEEYEY